MRTRTQRALHHTAPVRVLLTLMTSGAAWLVALAHLTAALHFALVSHEICADHGELVHETSAAHATALKARGAVALPAAEHQGHDHCPLFGRRLEQFGVLAAHVVAVMPAALTAASPVAEASGVAPSRAALLLSAPKQSPPVVG